MESAAIGIDIVEVERFRSVLENESSRFLATAFTDEERAYCFSYADPAPHLAGTFAAKEAVQKATGQFPRPLNRIEIRRDADGAPKLWCDGKRESSVLLSISHSDANAVAVALRT